MNTLPATSAPDPAAADAATAQAIEARKYVKGLRDFYPLLATAVIVIAISMFVNFGTGGPMWFYWLIFGFTIAIAFTALDTFGRNLEPGRDWQERKLRESLERQRH